MRVLAFDLETGGLSPSRCGITEIAAVVMEDGQPIEFWSAIVEPEDGLIYSEEALAVQKRTMGQLREKGIPFNDARRALDSLVKTHFGRTKDALCYAHNARFDVEFMDAACRRLTDQLGGRKAWCPVPFTTICTQHVFGHWLAATGTPAENRKLATACKTLGIPFDEDRAHGALYDARACALLASKLLMPSAWAIENAEEVLERA